MTSALDLLMDSDSTAETTTLLENNGICTIDSRTRTIFVPPEIVVGAVQSDKNAERIKFSCPKIVGDNLDLSKFSIRINFENVSSVDPDISIKDQYICEDASINGDNITFSWVIGKNAARYMGTIRFIVCAVKTDSDSNISIEWNTTVAQIPVLEGIEVDQPSFDENSKDVINQLLAITKTASDEAVKNVNSAKEQAITDIQNVSQPDKTLTVEGGIADAKATGNAISSLREDLANYIENNYIDILDSSTYEFGIKNGALFSDYKRIIQIPKGYTGNESYLVVKNKDFIINDALITLIILSEQFDKISNISVQCNKTVDGELIRNVATNIKKTVKKSALIFTFNVDLSDADEYSVYFTIFNSDASNEKKIKFKIFISDLSSNLTTIDDLHKKYDNYIKKMYDKDLSYKRVGVYVNDAEYVFLDVKQIANIKLIANGYDENDQLVSEVEFTMVKTGRVTKEILTNGIYMVNVNDFCYIVFDNYISEKGVPLSVDLYKKEKYVNKLNTKSISQKGIYSLNSDIIVGIVPLATDKSGSVYNYHISIPKTLRKSSDNLITNTNIYEFDDEISRCNVCENGNILVLLKKGKLMVSKDGGKTFNILKTFEYVPHILFGVKQYKNIVLYTTYENEFNTSSGREVWMTENGGYTIRKIFDLKDYTDSYNAHLHSAAYDPYQDIIWICSGDGISQQMIFYSLDRGITFDKVNDYGQIPFQATEIIPLRECVLFVTDQRLVGVFRWRRYDDFSKKNAVFDFENISMITESWGKNESTEVPIASTSYIDFNKSFAIFGYALVNTAFDGSTNNTLKNGQIYATNGDWVKTIYQSNDDVHDGIQHVIGYEDRIYAKFVNTRYNTLFLQIDEI